MKEVKRVFKVNGKPFFPIGAEFLYKSGYSVRDQSETETIFKAVKSAHGNTILIPIYWDQFEREEGNFDFTTLDFLLALARSYELKLMLLWFATWKNANMDFTPAWIKTDPQRFKRVISPTGQALWVLSSHCKANLAADKKAFTALCKYLKAKDAADHTVIGIQVENEAGIIGSDRDYGPEAQATLDSPVPAKLLSAMKTAGKGEVYDIWQQAGGKTSGNWTELFSYSAGELMSAWSIASYIDSVAEAGKKFHEVPMFINVWLMEQPWWRVPGESYASGGGVTKVLDIYKWFTPHIDMIAPDIYLSDFKGRAAVCASYSRDDNPLFIPESHGALEMINPIADYNCTGYFTWIREGTDVIQPRHIKRIDLIQCVASVIPLLLKYQGTGKVHAVVQEEGMEVQNLDLDGYMGLIEFGRWKQSAVPGEQPGLSRGGGLVIQESRNVFYLVGTNYRLRLRARQTTDKMQATLIYTHHRRPEFLKYVVSVDEGHFDQNDKFVSDRRRNGDEITNGFGVEADCGVVRVITCD